MRKNRDLINDHDLQTCKEIKYNLCNDLTEAYYTLTVQEQAYRAGKKDYKLVILNISKSRAAKGGTRKAEKKRRNKAVN